MQTLELKKIHKSLFSASAKTPQLVDVPRLNFLRIDGAIEPGHGPSDSPLFAENLQALYGASYTLKFMLKQRAENPVDYPVMALEGLWWVEDGRFDINIKDNWFYTVQIMQPDLVTPKFLPRPSSNCAKRRGRWKPSRGYDSNRFTKDSPSRCSTSALTRRSLLPLQKWTPTSRPRACKNMVTTTKSTSATRCAPTRPN